MEMRWVRWVRWVMVVRNDGGRGTSISESGISEKTRWEQILGGGIAGGIYTRTTIPGSDLPL